MHELLAKIVGVVVNPILKVAMVVATVLFVYGIFEFIKGASNPETLKSGQRHMIWGLVGLAIMVSVFSIVRILLNSVGADMPKILK